ncbi:MAG: ATP-binding cassette domain-containing protein [Planctomycetota bacterium]
MSGLVLEGVVARRGRFQVGPLSAEIPCGQLLWLAGANGSGKSTLLSVIAGLLRLAAGRVLFQDQVLTSAGSWVPPWQRPCSILLQDLGLWPHLSIRRQSTLVVQQKRSQKYPVEPRLEMLASSLQVVGLLDRQPSQLSGGEAQRCALLRALMPEAPLLLLDEPYSDQHPEGVACIDDVIQEQLAAGSVILLAGHRAPAGANKVELDRELSG